MLIKQTINIFFSLFLILPVYANDIFVIDGDSLIVNGVKTRMYGIDAPEYDQMCISNNEEYPCGQIAKQELQNIITDKTICSIKGKDKYDRILTICYNDGQDINAELVRKGLVVAYKRYSEDYIKQETEAKENNRGIWSGTFVYPEKYRIISKQSTSKNK